MSPSLSPGYLCSLTLLTSLYPRPHPRSLASFSSCTVRGGRGRGGRSPDLHDELFRLDGEKRYRKVIGDDVNVITEEERGRGSMRFTHKYLPHQVKRSIILFLKFSLDILFTPVTLRRKSQEILRHESADCSLLKSGKKSVFRVRAAGSDLTLRPPVFPSRAR